MRSNTATSLLSASIAIYWGVYEFVVSGPQNTSGIDLTLAVMAAAHALYGLTLYFVLAAHHARIAGLMSYLLFFFVSLYSLWISVEVTNTYFSVIAVAGMLSGLYGWLIATTLNASVLTLLVLINNGQFSANENFSTLQIVMYAAISVMTIILWTAIPSDDSKPRRKKHKKASKGDNSSLSTDILIDSITDGIAIIGTSGEIEVFNPSAQQITGWSADEAVGLDHRSVLIMTDQKDVILSDAQNPISRVLASGQPFSDSEGKLQTRSRTGTEVDVLVSPIKNADKVTSIIVIFRDVSKKRSEERQRAEFISTASHEMRTPVAAIEGYLALAMNNKVAKVDSVAKGYLEKAHNSTQHLGKLFQDLLTAAKSEDGRLINNPEAIEVGGLIDELIEGMRFTAEKKGLIMEANFGSNTTAVSANVVRPVAYVHVDPERIREVVTNLFDNAIKYTEEGKITIGLITTDKDATITVTDTGVGIPKEDVSHLFQKFYRVDNTATRQIGGTGLGLFISRKIVELYNGRLWVESDLGKGSTFNITLPRISTDRAGELIRMEEQRKAKAGVPIPTSMATAQAVPVAAPVIPTTTAVNASGTPVTTVDATGGQPQT